MTRNIIIDNPKEIKARNKKQRVHCRSILKVTIINYILLIVLQLLVVLLLIVLHLLVFKVIIV